MAAVQGIDVLIKVGADGSETLLAGTLSHSLKANQELQDATTKDSTGGWDEVIPSTRGASFSVQGVYDPDPTSGDGFLDMFDLLSAGTKTHCLFGPTGSGENVFECDAYVESVSLEAPLKDRTTYTVEFKVTGELSKTTNPA